MATGWGSQECESGEESRAYIDPACIQVSTLWGDNMLAMLSPQSHSQLVMLL